MKQLRMRRESAPVESRELPQGYGYEFFDGRREQIDDWLELCFEALIPTKEEKWFVDTILHYPDLCPARDLFFVVEQSTGRRVATTAAVCHGHEGYIHMVAAAPDVRGRGIGHAMLRYALTELEARGCTYSVLTTDDFRLAAIKTYLDAGFVPVIEQDPESNVRDRWEKVLAELHYTQHVQFSGDLI
ncbi:MAG: GNAT family N-acetyltransferase [Clostridia bacterium]|jgi:mycothiol synthase|nr:GNAT family N-acetyltransferase [Clostridia bacterium]